MLALFINGEERRFSAPLTLSALVGQLALTGKRIAIERNGEIVPKGHYEATLLGDGDRLEIVVAVGGG